jgi:uncharacterized cupredoxin-like copper-binding protein
MKHMRPIAIAAAFALALLGAALAGVVAHAGARATKTITVSEKEFKITLSSKKMAPGKVKLVVKNAGKLSHALVIAGPGVTKKRTPLIKPGKKATLTITVRSGKYAIWCPVPGHEAQGMKTTLTVTGTTTTTTDSGGGGGGYGGGNSGGTTTQTDTSGNGGDAWA